MTVIELLIGIYNGFNNQQANDDDGENDDYDDHSGRESHHWSKIT